MKKTILFFTIATLTHSSWAADISVATNADTNIQAAVTTQNNTRDNTQSAGLLLSGAAQQTAIAQTPPNTSTAEDGSQAKDNTDSASATTASTAINARGEAVINANKTIAAVNAQKNVLQNQGLQAGEDISTATNQTPDVPLNRVNSLNGQVQQSLDAVGLDVGTKVNALASQQISAVSTLEIDKALQGSVNQLVGSSVDGSINSTINNTINNSIQTNVEDTINSTVNSTINSTINSAVDSSITTALNDTLNLGN